ncbi:hypothetical protein Ae201684P_007021 [Aphanomyces euteiches]|nr:hypothetical protein Ae201684P_007021 [Aphanomyces euteiches]
MKEIQWRVSFPKLDRLVYRGNNMTSLRFNSSLNLPPERHPFSALDVGDNPNLSIVTLDGESYRFLKNNVTLTTDLLALTLAKRACNRGYIDIPQMQTVPVQYLPRGVAKYDYAKAFKIYVCFGPYEYTSGGWDSYYSLQHLLLALAVDGLGIVVMFLVLSSSDVRAKFEFLIQPSIPRSPSYADLHQGDRNGIFQDNGALISASGTSIACPKHKFPVEHSK